MATTLHFLNADDDFPPDGDAVLWLRLPDAADALQEKGGGEAGAEHMASPELGVGSGFLLFKDGEMVRRVRTYGQA